MRMSDWSSDVCSSYLPEPFGEGDLQGRRDLLVAEEDDDVVMEGLQDFGEERVVHRLRQVDAEDLRAERARARLDRDPGMGLTHGIGLVHFHHLLFQGLFFSSGATVAIQAPTWRSSSGSAPAKLWGASFPMRTRG